MIANEEDCKNIFFNFKWKDTEIIFTKIQTNVLFEKQNSKRKLLTMVLKQSQTYL